MTMKKDKPEALPDADLEDAVGGIQANTGLSDAEKLKMLELHNSIRNEAAKGSLGVDSTPKPTYTNELLSYDGS